jgi:hypothetical protein
MLSGLTTAQMASQMGVAEASLTAFASEALAQGQHMLQLVTGITAWPTGELELATAQRGVIELSEFIYYRNPYKGTLAKPFSSETIADYTYTIDKVRAAQPTGLMWWDEAVRLLTAEGSESVTYGGVSIFERDGVYQTTGGDRFVPGPSISDAVERYGYVPSVWETT